MRQAINLVSNFRFRIAFMIAPAPATSQGLITVMALGLAACSDIAASVAPAILPHHNQSIDVTDVPSGRYELDNSHTHIQFSVDHMGYSRLIGRFNEVSGSIQFDNSRPDRSPVRIIIQAASVDVIDRRLDEMLIGDDYFRADEFPEIRFEAEGISILNERSGSLPGMLTIRGVSRPVTLTVTYNGGSKNSLTGRFWLGFSAETKVRRSDFGMDDFVPMVGDETTIRIEAEFGRTGTE